MHTQRLGDLTILGLVWCKYFCDYLAQFSQFGTASKMITEDNMRKMPEIERFRAFELV